MKYKKQKLYKIDGIPYQYVGCSNTNYWQSWSYHVFYRSEASQRLRIQTKDLQNYKIEEIPKNE